MAQLQNEERERIPPNIAMSKTLFDIEFKCGGIPWRAERQSSVTVTCSQHKSHLQKRVFLGPPPLPEDDSVGHLCVP